MLCDDVREYCASVAAGARWIRIDPDAAVYTSGVAGLDPSLHLVDAPPEDVARYVLVLDAINFGSGWFDELGTDTNRMTAQLTEFARAEGIWALGAENVAEVLGVDGALAELYPAALRELDRWMGGRSALEAIDAGSAQQLAAELAGGMRLFDDPGFYKRAQITVNDLASAGVVAFPDLDELTAFADNLLPHVLRVDGVLVYDDELASVIDAGEEIPPLSDMERELRACAVHACELLAAKAGVPPRVLDNWLWNRGQEPPYSDGRPHRTKTVFY